MPDQRLPILDGYAVPISDECENSRLSNTEGIPESGTFPGPDLIPRWIHMAQNVRNGLQYFTQRPEISLSRLLWENGIGSTGHTAELASYASYAELAR